jgi:hypothetical protein
MMLAVSALVASGEDVPESLLLRMASYQIQLQEVSGQQQLQLLFAIAGASQFGSACPIAKLHSSGGWQ